MTKTELFFGGRRSSDGSLISKFQCYAFFKLYIQPKFDGFTVTKGVGYWMGVSEPSYTVIIVHTGTKVEKKFIQEIKKAYCQAFEQQCVGEVNTQVEAIF